MRSRVPRPGAGSPAARVIEHVQGMIEQGQLRPGDRLPPERELARRIGVSRPTVRAGLRWLAALGGLRARQGSGTFITDGPPRMVPDTLGLLAALHGFTRDEMFEARRVLEVGGAALAAQRALPEQVATLADEVSAMFAALGDPQLYLLHDVRFHQGVAAASGNPVIAVLVEMVSALMLEQRRLTVERARDLRESAEMHRRIYAAIRARDPERARQAMAAHLDLARMAQASEEDPQAPGFPIKSGRSAPSAPERPRPRPRTRPQG